MPEVEKLIWFLEHFPCFDEQRSEKSLKPEGLVFEYCTRPFPPFQLLMMTSRHYFRFRLPNSCCWLLLVWWQLWRLWQFLQFATEQKLNIRPAKSRFQDPGVYLYLLIVNHCYSLEIEYYLTKYCRVKGIRKQIKYFFLQKMIIESSGLS